ncbi:MAG: hypothetical protein JO270_23520 [Acidobacteriaceae bacterium]|nr:hypothetical protein [Acidobacteriaceae bacterium]MBV8571177.1 hypothetical protein [Acidobacteriaceae bacterium]
MKRAALALMLASIALAQTTSAVRLESGIAKEDVDGDLKSAIDIYQKVASDSTAPREVRAKALLHLAGCYEKLGRQQARHVYEQIVREYADQSAATEARTRLASLRQQEHPPLPTTVTVRKIEWSTLGLMDASDTDGQRAVFWDPGGNLYFGDLAGHTKRKILNAQPDAPLYFWNASKDVSMVALRFLPTPKHPATLAVIKTDGTGYRELIRDDPQGTILGSERFENPCTWSWDNRWLLVRSNRPKHGGSLLLVSVADGQRRELARIADGYFSRAVFSPDGRFVAYEVAPLPDHEETSHLFVIPAQGGEAHHLYESVRRPAQSNYFREHWVLLDWTSDGRNLAIADALTGKTALYLLPVKDGTVGGRPAFVRYGEFDYAYSTPSGALVYQTMRPGGEADVFVSAFDSQGKLAPWRRVPTRGGNMINPMASFSADGTHLAYVAEDEDHAAGSSLVWHDLSSGQERELDHSGTFILCESALHGPTIFCSEDEGGGTMDLFSVSVDTGEVKRLKTFHEPPGIVTFLIEAGPDDNSLEFMKLDLSEDFGGPLVRYDLATQKETVISIDAALRWPSLDGKWVVGMNEGALSVKPVTGGDWKPLASSKTGGWPFTTTRDGSAVLYMDIDPAGKRALYRVSITGGAPERLGDAPVLSEPFQDLQEMHISADGHQIVTASIDPNRYDLWLLENFVPRSKP